VIDVFITFSPTWPLRAFMCSRSRLTPARQNAGKERAEAGFRVFWNYINRLLVDYQKNKKGKQIGENSGDL
jgi:hypothetical protein